MSYATAEPVIQVDEDKTGPIELGVVQEQDDVTATPSAPEASSIILPDPLDAPTLVAYVKEQGIRLFRDSFGNAFVWYRAEENSSAMRIEELSRTARRFRRSLRLQLRKLDRDLTFPTWSVLYELLAEEADECVRELTDRVCLASDSIVIDIGSGDGQVVRVTPDGWNIGTVSEPTFYRFEHQLPLPLPTRHGDFTSLFDMLRIESEGEKLLLLAWLCAAFMPNCSKPILLQIGPPGAAKSTRSKIIRSIVDPSITGAQGISEPRSMIQIMFKHALPCFDNVGTFSPALSDFFCQAVCTNWRRSTARRR
jgi:hypothetical protein